MKTVVAIKAFALCWMLHANIWAQGSFFEVGAGFLKDEYFVGEIVDFYYGIRNPSADPTSVPSKRDAYDSFRVSITYIPSNRGERQEYLFVGPSEGKTKKRQVLLNAGEWYVYRLRILWSQGLPVRKDVSAKWTEKEKPISGLVFRKPGRYFAGFTPKFFDPRSIFHPEIQHTWHVSMGFRIKYPRPGSPEERVWREIRDGKMLEFIQTDGETGTPQLALKVAKILRDMPVSRYHNSLQAVLGAYYRRHWQKHNVGERALIDIALRRKFPPDIVPQNRRPLLRLLYRHAPELYRELNVKLAPEEKKPAVKK